jgi:glycosyltransferase involved in cell wall biosynthesis
MAPDLASVELLLEKADLSASVLGWWRQLRSVLRSLNETKAAIVHAHGVRAAAIAVPAARFKHRTVVVTVHGLHSLRRTSRWGKPFVGPLNRVVLRGAHRVLVLSAADASLVEENRLSLPSKLRYVNPVFEPIHPLPQGSARAILGIPPSARVALWLGRFDEQKDPLTFVRAMERLESAEPVIGLMVGDGPLIRVVSERVREEAANIALTGWLEDPALAFASADVYVSTSRWEGMALTVLEAAAAGLPLILSDSPGNNDCSSPMSSVSSFPIGDSQALADLLRLSLSRKPIDPSDLPAAELREFVERHSAEQLAESVFAAYEESASVP